MPTEFFHAFLAVHWDGADDGHATFSPPAGTYSSAQTVTISDTTAGATIFFTTDGSTPTTSSTMFTTPIVVGSTTTLKAIAAAPGFANSAVATAVYTIAPPAATPTFSVPSGTYTSVANGGHLRCHGWGNNLLHNRWINPHHGFDPVLGHDFGQGHRNA